MDRHTYTTLHYRRQNGLAPENITATASNAVALKGVTTQSNEIIVIIAIGAASHSRIYNSEQTGKDSAIYIKTCENLQKSYESTINNHSYTF